jgi:hypothetical protein
MNLRLLTKWDWDSTVFEASPFLFLLILNAFISSSYKLEADILLILTAVEKVSLHFGKPNQTDLKEVADDQMRQYMEEGAFRTRKYVAKSRSCCTVG